MVVLVVCGFLVCGCIVLPIGVGVGFFYVAAARSQAAMAQEAIAQQRAVAAQARAVAAQAEVQAMQNAQQQSLPTLPTELPAGVPAPPKLPASPPKPAESANV